MTYAGLVTHLTTAELVARCIDGDAAAWEEMVSRHGELVRYVARQFRLTAEECDDVAQHCWLQLVQRIETIRDPARCGDWLATVARHESLKVLARGRRAVPVEAVVLELCAGRTDAPELEVLRQQMWDEVESALDRLPERQREFLRELLSDETVRYADVADRLGMQVGSVGQTKSRSLRRLRQELLAKGVTRYDLAG